MRFLVFIVVVDQRLQGFDEKRPAQTRDLAIFRACLGLDMTAANISKIIDAEAHRCNVPTHATIRSPVHSFNWRAPERTP